MRLPHLLGNERLKAALAPLNGTHFGSAALLEGPAGSGKHTAAQDLAMGLLCRSGDPPCQTCPACRRVAAGTHPDLVTLVPEDGKKSVSVAQVRALRARSFLQPNEGVTKVFILPDADKLNPQSQNALLKVLEEPEDTVFLLLCENRQSVLQTVRSRCRVFALAPLSEALIAERLRAEGASPAQASALAARCDGVLGRALDELHGGEHPTAALAERFLEARTHGELDVFSVCLELGKLSREDYAVFCDDCCRAIVRAGAQRYSPRDSDLYDELKRQQGLLIQNPSVAALAAVLCARCGSD